MRNVDYTVVSAGSWATDTGGPISCSNNSKSASNIRIVSEVSSPATKGIVDEVSLVTPPPGTYATGQGRGIVKVVNRDQVPVAGAPVNLTGPSSFSATTNSLGCAVFPYIPIGNYTATVPGLGVDWEGNSSPSKPLSVTQSASTAQTFEIDSPAEIRATFDTAVNGTTSNAESRWLTLTNPKLIVGSKLFTAPTGSPDTEAQINATGLFPFLDGYTAYPGQCPANAAGAKTYIPTPGQIFLTTSNKLRVPSINIRVVTSSSTSGSGPAGVNGATVIIKSDDSGCANVFPNQTTNSSGALPQPGFPYGRYRLCAQRTVSGTTTHGHADIRPYSTSTGDTNEQIVNTAAAGNPVAFNTTGAIRLWLNRSGACH